MRKIQLPSMQEMAFKVVSLSIKGVSGNGVTE
jgi:hypothetical protein